MHQTSFYHLEHNPQAQNQSNSQMGTHKTKGEVCFTYSLAHQANDRHYQK